MRRLRSSLYDAYVTGLRNYSLRRAVIRTKRRLKHHGVPVSHAAARRYWRQHFGVNICTRWHYVYAQVSGRDDPRYVPGDLFYARLVPALNNAALVPAYVDKNLYSRWLPEDILPVAVLRCVHGRFLSRDFQPVEPDACLEDGEYFIKPSLFGSGGRQVEVLRIKGGMPAVHGVSYSWLELRRQYHGNFVVQRRLVQHPAIAALNESSINTLRILTLRLDEPWVAASVIRIGAAGSHVDNVSAGHAVVCGILPDGRLNTWATDPQGNRVLTHPDGGYRFGGQEVPGIRDAWDLVVDLHHSLFYFDLVAWDVTIGPDSRPRLVEVNLRAPGINMHQLNAGPLFGDRTEEVLHYVRARRRG